VFNDKIQHQINANDDSRNALLTTPGRLPALLVICRNAQTNLRANFKPSTLIKQATRHYIKSRCENIIVSKGNIPQFFVKSLPPCFSQEYDVRWLKGIFRRKQNSSMICATFKDYLRITIWLDQFTITTNTKRLAKHNYSWTLELI
jgi:hypothetical protein